MSESQASRRAIAYCIVPEDLADKLHEPLRRHFAEAPRVEVVVEQRWRDRRAPGDRRSADEEQESVAEERRRIRAVHGRRVADRRAAAVSVSLPGELPRKVKPHVDRLVFVERLEPSTQQLEDIDTARLVARIQAGDAALFSELYLRYFDRVFSYLRVAFRDEHEAEDVTQEVFVSILEALPRYERRTQPFRAWLFVILRRHALSRLERRQRQEVTDPVDMNRYADAIDTDDPSLSLDWLTDRDLMFLIERLPLAQRQVLMLRYLLDLDYANIAEVLDRNPDDVRKLHQRARSYLEQRLRGLGRGPRVTQTPGDSVRCKTFLRKAPVLRARRFALIR